MSLHSSLKTKSGALSAHRNVLSRAERVAKLTEQDRFDPETGRATALPKVRNIKASTGKKKPTAEAGDEKAEKGKKK